MEFSLADWLSQGGMLAVVGVLIWLIVNERKAHAAERKEDRDAVLAARNQYAELAEDAIAAQRDTTQVMARLTEAISKLETALAMDRRMNRIEALLGQKPGNGGAKDKDGGT